MCAATALGAEGDMKQPVELLVSVPEREPVTHTLHPGHSRIQTRAHVHRYTERDSDGGRFSLDKPRRQKATAAQRPGFLRPSHLDDRQRGNLIITYELLIFCKGTSLVFIRNVCNSVFPGLGAETKKDSPEIKSGIL